LSFNESVAKEGQLCSALKQPRCTNVAEIDDKLISVGGNEEFYVGVATALLGL